MTALHLTVGPPGSGKSTWARAWVDQARATGAPAARINRDDLRVMMYGRLTGVPEDHVTAVVHAAVRALLALGVDVVCDNTNLRRQHRQALAEIGQSVDAQVVEHREFLDVPLTDCVRRDLARGVSRVGIAEITRLMNEAEL
ncbi:AAA family ATPase [Cryptosporangium aurantiacum]|uniref:AAA domain-containing protein n=1 Tax=Cryptosporangium aurantiacum TaxID=134849 RepID=A0A1M7RJX1_9ACTN|nr:AAA family ATPase [Cryptosporangium aurantiacum]SHN46440.1 AAA domain-containing protein [Cryptosporangium aurantiacum]